eukprot:scaffold77281_cov56-Attheya_sp.AAC.4
MAKVVKDITTAASKNKCHPTEEQSIVIGTFAARWPNVLDTAFKQVLLAGGIQLASQTNLIKFDREKFILEFDDIGKSLELSRTSITNAVLFTATHMLIVNAERLAKSKKLGKIVELNLDFDKSGDKAKDGGLAIQHSLEKYVFGNRQWKISGGSLDSGGGFTGQLAKPVGTWKRILAVLISLAHGLCGSTTKSSNLAMCAGNFKSLANEDEIRIDLAFLSDFDKIFVCHEMEFNHSTDPNIGHPGHLRIFRKNLKNGTVDQSPFGAKLKSFWAQILEGNQLSSKENSLKKARRFLEVYLLSLAKHNAQFVSPYLLFLATVGEFETGTMVAKMLVQCAIKTRELQFDTPLEELATFKSAIHQQDIGSVFKIAGGVNVWDGAAATEVDQNLYLIHFGALPSTAEMVERAVKKAKLCQKTGKGEKNVTAYGIAGDGLKEACAEQLVLSSYATRMEENRNDQKRQAEEAGHEA